MISDHNIASVTNSLTAGYDGNDDSNRVISDDC